MKLYHAGASPFARKVRIAAIELGLAQRITLESVHVTPGKPNADYAQAVNPLRKVPALVLADGRVLADSSLACRYLDELDGNGHLVPREGEARWQVLADHALANGMTEAAVALRYERAVRPEENRWSVWQDDLVDRIRRVLDRFETTAPDAAPTGLPDLAVIALVSGVEYLDFRHPDIGWREDRPRLADFCAVVGKRASFRETAPGG